MYIGTVVVIVLDLLVGMTKLILDRFIEAAISFEYVLEYLKCYANSLLVMTIAQCHSQKLKLTEEKLLGWYRGILFWKDFLFRNDF